MAMAFRGLGKPTDQLDIQLAQPSGFGPIDPGMSMPSQMPMPTPQAPEPQKMGTGRMIAGAVGDALAQWAGMQPTFGPAMRQHQEMLRRAQQQQQQRMADRDDYVWKLQQKAQFPDPVSPHYWETNDGSLGMVGPDGKPTILYKDPTPKINWIKADNGDGTFDLVPVGPDGPISPKGGDPGLGGAGSTPAPSPSSGGFMTADQYNTVRQGLGSGFGAWQSKYQVPVLVKSAEEMALLPSGTPVLSPDGRRGVKK